MIAKCAFPALLGLFLLVAGTAMTANTPPAAEFTAYRARSGGETEILLDGSRSRDPDGEIVSYQWVFGDGATGSGRITNHTYSSLGKVNITLYTFDDGGSWHLITKTVDLSLVAIAPEGLEPGDRQDEPSPAESDSSISVPTVAPTTAPIGAAPGYRAPEFALTNPEGTTVRLSDFLGHVVLIEFWKSTCGACEAHTPQLDALSRTLTEQGLVVVLIVLDPNLGTAVATMRDRGYTRFILLHETRPYTAGTLFDYRVPGTPHAVLIDQSGEIRFAGHPSDLAQGDIERLL